MSNGKTISKHEIAIADLTKEVSWLMGEYEVLKKQMQNLIHIIRQTKNV